MSASAVAVPPLRARGHAVERVRIPRAAREDGLTDSYGVNANSAVFDFASTMAPASRTRRTMKVSWRGRFP